MRKVLSVSLLAILILLSGCSSKDGEKNSNNEKGASASISSADTNLSEDTTNNEIHDLNVSEQTGSSTAEIDKDHHTSDRNPSKSSKKSDISSSDTKQPESGNKKPNAGSSPTVPNHSDSKPSTPSKPSNSGDNKPEVSRPETSFLEKPSKPGESSTPPTVDPPTESTDKPEKEDFNIQTLVDYAVSYGKTLKMTYVAEPWESWDTPILVKSNGENAARAKSDIEHRLQRYHREGMQYFGVWSQFANGKYEIHFCYG